MNLLLELPRFFLSVFRPRAIHSMSSSSGAAQFEMRHSNPPGLWTSPRLTQMVEVQGARMIYLSGQTAADANYQVHSRDFHRQAHSVYDNIERALRSAGATLNDIVKTTTYLTDAGHIAALREVRLERYKQLQGPSPANTLLVVSRLAEPEFLIEIDVVAALPSR